MPQMAPMSWMMLSIMFFLSTIMFMSVNYFNINYHKTPYKSTNKTKTMIWKW